MKYHVFWRKTSRDHLLAIWKTDSDRSSITEAIAFIEDLLEAKPASVGEQLNESQRIVVHGPLAAVYFIDESKSRVIILSVRVLPGRSTP